MKNKRMLSFIMALITFGLVLPLSSCKSDHKPVDEWTYNDSTHWHECVEEDCDEKFNEANHTYKDWVVTKEATCTEEGTREKECTVCGYKVTETIAALGHKAASWEVTRAPTQAMIGKVTVTCSCGYVEEFPLPPLDEVYYEKLIEQTDNPLINKTYYLLKDSALLNIITGTLLEGNDEARLALVRTKFGEKDVDVACKHDSLVVNLVKAPTLTSEGSALVKCMTCNKEATLPLHKLGATYHNTIARNDGKVTYKYRNINLADLFYEPYLKPVFKEMSSNTISLIMNEIRKFEFVDDWYNLDISVNDVLHDPVFDTTKVEYIFKISPDELHAEEVVINNSNFSYKFVTGTTCDKPLIKEAYINDTGLGSLSGPYRNHPSFKSLIQAVKVFTLTPTDLEISQNVDKLQKHKIGEAYIKEQPTSTTGAVLSIKCNNSSKCHYQKDIDLVHLNNSQFFTKTYNKGKDVYTANESYINSLAHTLSADFDNTISEIKEVIAPLLKFEVVLKVNATVTKMMNSDTSQPTIKLSHPGYDNVESFVFPYTLSSKPQYFKVTYVSTSCDTMIKRVSLNDTGAGVASRLAKIIPVNNARPALDNLVVGELTPTDAEIKANKTMFHNFVLDTITPNATQDNTQNGAVYLSCNRGCNKTFFVTYSFNEAFVEGDTGYLVLDASVILTKFATKYPSLAQQELDAIEKIIWDHINEF